jgi:hypothetical protein
VYTLLNPETVKDKLYHTVAHLATGPQVVGLQDPTLVGQGVWAEFSDTSVSRYNGDLMKYDHTAGADNGSMAAMLTSNLGTCVAWGELLVAVLGAQGIEAKTYNVAHKNINPPAVPDHMIVIDPVTGAPPKAQGTAGASYTANNIFNIHVLVKLDSDADTLYDPSYGTKTAKTGNLSALARYEDLYIPQFITPGAVVYGQTLGVEDMKLFPR